MNSNELQQHKLSFLRQAFAGRPGARISASRPVAEADIRKLRWQIRSSRRRRWYLEGHSVRNFVGEINQLVCCHSTVGVVHRPARLCVW